MDSMGNKERQNFYLPIEKKEREREREREEKVVEWLAFRGNDALVQFR